MANTSAFNASLNLLPHGAGVLQYAACRKRHHAYLFSLVNVGKSIVRVEPFLLSLDQT
jgi:hypothetical protein